MVITSSSDSSDNNGNNFPEDLLVNEVLPRLPIESIKRYKCVSKKWLQLISDVLAPSYLPYHSKKLQVILARNLKPDSQSNYRLCCLVDESKVVELDATYVSKGAVIGIAGSSNGLVCVKYLFDDTRTMLWNPATTQWRNVPRAPNVRIDRTNSMLNVRNYAAMGFGFDERSKDYKLARIVEVYEKLGDCVALSRSVCVVQVFTASSNSWREAKRITGCSYQKTRHGGVLWNGALYWVVETDDIRRYQVLSFDLHEENLHTIDLPDLGPDNRRHSDFRLTKLEESLAFLSISSSLRCEIFVMRSKETDHKQSWTPLFSALLPPLYSYTGLWKDQLLVLQQNGIKQELYFLTALGGRRNRLKLIKVLETGWRFFDETHEYVPSLVSVYPNQKKGNGQIIDCSI